MFIDDGPSSARWQISGQGSYISGQSVSMPAGISYTVSFSEETGWTRPANFNVTVTAGQTSMAHRSYAISPAALARLDELSGRLAPILYISHSLRDGGGNDNGPALSPGPVSMFTDNPLVLRVNRIGESLSYDIMDAHPNAGWIAYKAGYLSLPDRQRTPTAYVRYAVEKDAVFIQYWFLYYYNEFPTIQDNGVGLGNRHEGDWEMVQYRFAGNLGALIGSANATPIEAAYAVHPASAGGPDGNRFPFSRVAKELLDDGYMHPVVYIAEGSNANYFAPGIYERGALRNDDAAGPINGIRVIPDIVVLPQEFGQDHWLNFDGLWGEHEANANPFDDGAHTPSNQGDRWDNPMIWSSGLPLAQDPTGVGTIQVTISDGPRQARWQVDGQGSYASGETIWVPMGLRTVSFSVHDGWERPDNIEMDVQADGTRAFRAAYRRITEPTPTAGLIPTVTGAATPAPPATSAAPRTTSTSTPERGSGFSCNADPAVSDAGLAGSGDLLLFGVLLGGIHVWNRRRERS